MKLWLAVDPMLNSPTETSVAGSTLSWEANMCFGQRFQMTPWRDSLMFWDMPLRHHLRSSGSASFLYRGTSRFPTSWLIGVAMFPLCCGGGSPEPANDCRSTTSLVPWGIEHDGDQFPVAQARSCVFSWIRCLCARHEMTLCCWQDSKMQLTS